jgi:hypothetical protein
MHKLTLTNGLRLIAHNLLHVPDTFKTPSEVMQAARIIELLDCPAVTPAEATEEWQGKTAPEIELTERQRDLLKTAVEKHASRLPPTRHVVSLLSQLGFE